ncbi:MAG: LamG domain-containing protein, partial [Planctomycetota bacterium]
MKRLAILSVLALAFAACQEATAPTAVPVVPSPQHAIAQPSGLVSWWPGDPEPFQEQLLFEDTFDPLDLSNWFTFGDGTVESRGGKLHLETAPTGPVIMQGLVFAGDFDITVDFSDFEHFFPGSPLDLGSLNLTLIALPTVPYSGDVGIGRESRNGVNSIITGVAIGFSRHIAIAPYTATSGQFRIFRNGTNVTTQFRASPAVPFTTLADRPWIANPVLLKLAASAGNNFGTGIRGSFDNLKVISSAADAIDIVGGNTGKFRGGSFAPGKVGQAFHFTDGVATLQSQPPLSQGFTIDAWVSLDNTGAFSNRQNIFSTGQALLGKATQAGFYTAILLPDGSELTAISGTVPAPGVFYHVAGTWDGTTLRVYVDGQPEAVRSAPGPLSSTLARPQMGRGLGKFFWVQPFFGLIDELRIFDRALSISEIGDICECGAFHAL